MTVLPGDFCCVPVSGPVGWAISFGEFLNGARFTEYDHAEIFVGLPDNNAPFGYTFSAYPGGAAYVPLKSLPESMDAVWSGGHINLTDQERDSIVSNCSKLKGIPYSSLDYFALAAHRFHIPVPELKKYIASSKHMICSQLVDYVYMESGVRLFNDNRWPGYVTPADLASLLGK